MPNYDYKCEFCGYIFEQFQTITAKLLRVCPNCGKSNLKRLIGSGTGIIFKGKDWPGQDIMRSKEIKPKDEN